MRLRRVLVGCAVALGVTAAMLPAKPAEAAGIVTHAWIALDAIDQVQSDSLRTLLDAHRDQVRAGAEFPDGGYWTDDTPAGDYGEEAHWQRFVDAYIERIQARTDCGLLTDPNGPCAPEIAHLMGVAAHGMGDEVWDWLFEPYGPDLGETYIPPDLAAFIGTGGLEFQMDVMAIVDHGRPTDPTPAEPSLDDLLTAFAASGKPQITAAKLAEGKEALQIERAVEAIWAVAYHDDIKAHMPWTSAIFTIAPGGVSFGAQAIAGYYFHLWRQLLDKPVTTKVVATYPANQTEGVPATGWVRSYQAGSHATGGGARTRITAVLSYSLPYVAAGSSGHTPAQLPAGAMVLREARTGQVVPTMAGYPRIVPYNPDTGEHLVDLQPAVDLLPCRWYRVEVTDELIDASGQPVRPYSWRFRTARADGRACR